MKTKHDKSVLWAIAAAVLYALSTPASKYLLAQIPPTLLASLLYLGAGSGMFVVHLLLGKNNRFQNEAALAKNDMPYILGMIILDIAAPVCLLIGLSHSASSSASLLNNFEIVATSLIAWLVFKEKIRKSLWSAILLITAATLILSFKNAESLSFSFGSFFILLACLFWGLENNCTRLLSSKNPVQIVIIKGLGSGLGALLIALFLKEKASALWSVIIALLLGFFSYGLSILFYVYAQRKLGAAKTSTYYAVAPFIGAGISIAALKEPITFQFILAVAVMSAGVYFASK